MRQQMRVGQWLGIISGIAVGVIMVMGSVPVHAEELTPSPVSEVPRVHLAIDKQTLVEKGFTVGVDDNKFQIGIPKKTLSEDVVVTMQRVDNPLPEQIVPNLASAIVEFTVDRKGTDPLKHPLFFTARYEDPNLRSVGLYYWDGNRNEWTRLSSRMDAVNQRVKGVITLTSARLALISEAQSRAHFDAGLRARGQVVQSVDGAFQAAVLPGLLKSDLDVLVTLRENNEVPAPDAAFTRVSNIYSLDVKDWSGGVVKLDRPVPIEMEYASSMNRERAIYLYDSNRKSWTALPSKDFASRHVVRAVVPTPFSMLAVLEKNNVFEGRASWFRSSRFTHGGATHFFPIGSKVRVTNLDTKASVAVEIFSTWGEPDGRVIDITSTAFKEVARLGQGTFRAKIERIE